MIIVRCHTCDAQSKELSAGLGRARTFAWLTHHQGHDLEETHR